MFCFFFFKQKTAYEMRISDWSSDVCSSDLLDFAGTPSGTREQDDLRLLQLGHLAPRVERRVIEVADGRADSPFAANQRADIRLHIDPLMPRRHGAGLPRLQLDDVANPRLCHQPRGVGAAIGRASWRGRVGRYV